ncbi:MAG: hypothetical protein ABI039_02370 [Vicinamibacterales bacterium]
MQDRRYRPGDVLDDYCPRERRITDHAIVAMIDDEIRQTRCGICDAEHEYKGGKVPAPRRKTQPPALFTQVLDNLNGSPPQPQTPASVLIESARTAAVGDEPVATAIAPQAVIPPPLDAPQLETAIAPTEGSEPTDEENGDAGGFRRSLIRATFPRPEGQAPTPRAMPEFTIQSLHNRRNNNQRNAGGPNQFRGGRRRPGAAGGSQDNLGPMRFRDHGSQQGDRPPGQGQGQGGGRRRRGGKKNR